MARLAWILVAAAAPLAGCTPAYRVRVNTYSELDGPLDQAARIYVAADPNSENPILRRQIASKIRDLLSGDGYNPVETQQGAAYTLTFEMGIDSQRVMDYASMSRSFGGFFGGGGRYGRGFGMGWGYSTYVPYVETVYNHWLRMKLYSMKDASPNPENDKSVRLSDRQTVWLGEAMVGTESPEFREAVNYLLVGCIQYLGVDTEEWISLPIKKDDPRIQGITTE
ncbi:MAG TPA: hypothetical protein VLI39_00045 [Sedimentisphaerales bacterium]|nr:hypothetical protein [Sedimentisphaerales bacterium]